MPPKPPLEPEQIKLLRDDLDLLHLLFHRNKNQHRLLKWWQWFGTLRRNLNKLLAEHDLVTAAKSTPQRNEALQRYTKRAEFLRRIVVPSAYNAFCSVIANKNFAPLGLVLTGVLGRVWKVIRPTEELEEERVDLGAEVALKSSMAKEINKGMGVVSRELHDGASDEEVGVVVSRADYGIDEDEEEDGDNQRKPSEAELEDKGEGSPLKVYSAPKLQFQKEKTRKNKSKQPQGFVERAPTPRSAMESGKTWTETIGSPSIEPVRKPKRKLGTGSDKTKQKKKKKADVIDDLFRGLF